MEQLNYYHVFKVLHKNKYINKLLPAAVWMHSRTETSAAHLLQTIWYELHAPACTVNNLLLITTLAHTYFCVWFSVFRFNLSDLLAVRVDKSGE